MSIVAGCDVGSLTSKAVVMKNGKVVGSAIIKSKVKPQESADKAMNDALSAAGLTLDHVQCCVGTGYGRNKISFVDKKVSEISCHGKGANWLSPAVRTAIDIGGQDCKAIKLDGRGKVEKFVANDKCASGTGRFLEVMAGVLGIDLSELGACSSKARSPVTFAASCTVWAQADAVKLLNNGTPFEEIGAGINTAMASRVAILVNSISIEPAICMTGGVAKNEGVKNALEKIIGHRILKVRKADPQLAGAIGAALFALEDLNGRGS